MELLQLLIFFSVSLGVVAGAFVWTEIAKRDQIRAVKSPRPGAGEVASRAARRASIQGVGRIRPDRDGPAPGSPDRLVRASAFRRPGAADPLAAPPRPLAIRWRARLREWLDRAGLRLSPGLFLAVVAGAAAALFAAGWLIQGALLAIPASLAGAAGPWLYLRVRLNACARSSSASCRRLST